MMRLNEGEEDSNDAKSTFIEIAVNMISILACLLAVCFIIYACAKEIAASYSQSPVEVNSYLTDIYRIESDKGIYKYYMKVDCYQYGLFEIEISKSDFMKYRVSDIVPVIIRNDKAYIVNSTNQLHGGGEDSIHGIRGRSYTET